MRELSANGKTTTLDLNGLKTVIVDNNALPTCQVDYYYIPSDPTFPVVDSWTSKCMFQMTVSAAHPIKSASKQFLALKQLNVPAIIVFVVPMAMFRTFERQQLVLANGMMPSPSASSSSSSANDGPQGGWNNLQQCVLGL